MSLSLSTLCRTEYLKALRSDTIQARLESRMGVIKYPESNRTAHSYSLLPPAAKNPFEKGFLDLPKLFYWDGLDTVFFFVPFVSFVVYIFWRWILGQRLTF